MKLLYCQKCGDAFNLQTERMKACSCGETQGKYINKLEAEYSGEFAVPFAIDNFSFFARVNDRESEHSKLYDKFYGKSNVQCWLLNKGVPGEEHIRKIKKDEPKKVKSLGRCK